MVAPLLKMTTSVVDAATASVTYIRLLLHTLILLSLSSSSYVLRPADPSQSLLHHHGVHAFATANMFVNTNQHHDHGRRLLQRRRSKLLHLPGLHSHNNVTSRQQHRRRSRPLCVSKNNNELDEAARSPTAAPTSEATTSSSPSLSSLSSSSSNLREYQSETSSLFGNIRIPAALFAGASAGAAFAMPVAGGIDGGVTIGLTKRLYALLMMSSLTFEIIAVVVSTLVVATVSTKPCPPTNSLEDLLTQQYALEWTATRFHFLAGVLLFVVGIGIRAWITIGCPIIARAALGIVLTGTLMCIAFVEEELQQSSSTTTSGGVMNGILNLPLSYAKLMIDKSSKRPLFGLTSIMAIITSIYIVVHIPHTIRWLQQ
jgi:hypothetical protein